jgi:electron transfer flavoprotein beta subunit
MKIYVCVKHVPDSAATIRITGPDEIDENITFLLNPYDENAVEAAVQLKSEIDHTEIIAVSVSKQAGIDTLRSALAMGADRGIHVVTKDRPDSMVTARALKAAISSDGTPGLILTGKAAIDSDGFQTQFRLAALLDMPVATNVTAIRPQNDTVTVTCALEAGSEQIVRMSLPGIIGAAKTLNTPRYPTFPDIIKARKKKIIQVPLSDLDITPSASRMEIIGLRPAVEKRQPRIIDGPPEKIVSELIRRLAEEAKIKLVS